MSDGQPNSHLTSSLPSSQTPPAQGAFPVPDVLEEQAKKKIEDIVFGELKLPPRQGREIATRITEEILIVTQESHSGPIPNSREMQGYEAASPGLANRVMGMAEIEQSARHSWYNKVLNRQFVLAIMGQLFAFLFGCGLIYVAYLLGMANHDWLAGLAFTGGGLGLASSFLKRMSLFSGQSETSEKKNGADAKPASKQAKNTRTSNGKARRVVRSG